MVIFIILTVILILLTAALCPWHSSARRPVTGKYAHRGLHDAKAAENSLEAFGKAVKAGYGIELDVHLSSDGEVIVFHDDTLLRACGRDARVDAFAAAELKEMKIFGTDCRIPTFREVLDLVDGRIPLIVEIKTGGKLAELCEKTAAMLAEYPGVYCVESFDPRVLLWFKQHAPQVLRGQLSMNFLREREPGMSLPLAILLTGMLTNFLTRPDFIAYQLKDQKALPFVICRKIFREPTAAWTVRSYEEEKQSQKNFDSIIFENFRA